LEPIVALRGNVYLTGFMGAGKSAVGRALARLLGRPFLDTDALIERRAGRSVAQIFAAGGEPAFRRLERQAVARAARRRGIVCALGGGALLHPPSRRLVASSGLLVALTCSERELWRRLKPTLALRPLLSGGRPALRRLLRARRGAYARADISVSTSALSAPRAARLIARRLRG
jgi:shikimate kinase